MSSLFMLAMLHSAHATSYTAELAVPSSPPPHYDAGDRIARALYHSNAAPVSVSSTHPNLYCQVRDGWIFAEFSADPSAYPSLPISGVCTLGQDSLTVTAVPFSTDVDPATAQATIINDHILFRKIQGAVAMRAYPLPGGNWVSGEFVATLNGTRCTVVQTNGGGWMVQVWSAVSAATGTGSCALPRSGAGTYTLNLTVQSGQP